MLEFAEATLDQVSLFIPDDVVWDYDFSGSIGGDDRLGSHRVDSRSQSVAIIGFVGKNGLSFQPVEQSWRRRYVAGLTRRYDKAHRAAKRIGQHMYLCRQSTSGTPHRLIARPPFPLAACW